MLTDSTQFDSSYDRGEPTEFNVDRLIAGFSEALQLMSVGSHVRVTIPPELAYGETGYGDVIGPNETLIFEIELLDHRRAVITVIAIVVALALVAGFAYTLARDGSE